MSSAGSIVSNASCAYKKKVEAVYYEKSYNLPIKSKIPRHPARRIPPE
jgi:hypothetical protein